MADKMAQHDFSLLGEECNRKKKNKKKIDRQRNTTQILTKRVNVAILTNSIEKWTLYNDIRSDSTGRYDSP